MTTPTLFQCAQTGAVAEEYFLGTEKLITRKKFVIPCGFDGTLEVL
jgi:hypothetical protein